jgi:hypothetical protein
MQARLVTRILKLTIAAATISALAGCTPAGPSVKPATPKLASTSAAIANGLPAGVTPAPVPTDVPNDHAARQNVRLTTCAATKAGWQAAGTVTNSGSKPAEYTITVFFTTKSATVIDTVQTRVRVPAGKAEHWSAAKEFPTTPGMLCVLRGVG